MYNGDTEQGPGDGTTVLTHSTGKRQELTNTEISYELLLIFPDLSAFMCDCLCAICRSQRHQTFNNNVCARREIPTLKVVQTHTAQVCHSNNGQPSLNPITDPGRRGDSLIS